MLVKSRTFSNLLSGAAPEHLERAGRHLPEHLVHLVLRNFFCAWHSPARMDWRHRWTAGERVQPEERLHVMRTVAHLMPFAAVAGGILILLKPQLVNYVVAVYLILVGTIGINHIYHFIR
jgi:Protein of unknown function (DUF3096)